jgi:hypothetical protein
MTCHVMTCRRRGDQDAPRDDDPCPDGAAGGGWDRPGQNDNDDASQGRGLAPAWPTLPAVIPPAFAKPEDGRPRDGRPRDGRRKDGRPAAGLLDVSMPWQTLAGTGPGPGHLGRIGPLTALQARRLAECAAGDPAAEWRIIVTTPTGHALAVTRIHGRRGRDRPPRPADGTGSRPGSGIGLVGRVTLTVPDELLSHPPPHGSLSGSGLPGGILARALQAAADAAARARACAAADAAAGGCAHDAASPGYRPPPRLRDHVVARDLTCRFPRCRQPAWRGDLDHTIPFDDGGLTCRCNLGGLCRTHHIIKHHPGWKLEQIAPGIFRWTTPSGRTFTATPDTHPL